MLVSLPSSGSAVDLVTSTARGGGCSAVANPDVLESLDSGLESARLPSLDQTGVAGRGPHVGSRVSKEFQGQKQNCAAIKLIKMLHTQEMHSSQPLCRTGSTAAQTAPAGGPVRGVL